MDTMQQRPAQQPTGTPRQMTPEQQMAAQQAAQMRAQQPAQGGQQIQQPAQQAAQRPVQSAPQQVQQGAPRQMTPAQMQQMQQAARMRAQQAAQAGQQAAQGGQRVQQPAIQGGQSVQPVKPIDQNNQQAQRPAQVAPQQAAQGAPGQLTPAQLQQMKAQQAARMQAQQAASQQAVAQQAAAQQATAQQAAPQQAAPQQAAPQQAGAQQVTRSAEPQQAAQNAAQSAAQSAPEAAQPQQMHGVQKQAVVRMFQPDMNALKAATQPIFHREGLKLKLYGQSGEVVVVVTAQTAAAAAATELAKSAADQISAAMGDCVYGFDNVSLADVMADELVEADMMLCAANTETGHLLEAELKGARQGQKVFDFGQMSFRNARMAEKIEKASIMDDDENPPILQQAADRSYAAAKCTKSEFGTAIAGTQGGDMVCAAVTYKKHVYVRCIRPAPDAAKSAVLSLLDMVRRLALGMPVPYARMFLAGEEIDWNNPLDPTKKQKGGKMIVPIVLLVAVALALGVGIYAIYNLFFAKEKGATGSTAASQTSSETVMAPQSIAADPNAAAPVDSAAAPDAAAAPADGTTVPEAGADANAAAAG